MKRSEFKQTRAQRMYSEWTLDVLIYTTILNVFVIFVDEFYVENFIYSIGAAIILKALLLTTLRFDNDVASWFKKQKGKAYRLMQPVVSFAIKFGSRYVFLAIIDFVFGNKVNLDNVIALVIMVIVMVVTRELMNRLYDSLGDVN